MTIRPLCKRCNGPLDFFFDPETNHQEWVCNNSSPLRSDIQFNAAWNLLSGDQVVYLLRKLEES